MKRPAFIDRESHRRAGAARAVFDQSVWPLRLKVIANCKLRIANCKLGKSDAETPTQPHTRKPPDIWASPKVRSDSTLSICNLQFAIRNLQSLFFSNELSVSGRMDGGVKPRRSLTTTNDPRRGTVLIVILVLIVMLALAAYTFSETMIVENESSEFALRGAQARAAAESGIEFVAAALGAAEDPEAPLNLYHDTATFAGVLVADNAVETARSRFTLVAPLESDATGTRVRAGLIDESARLNLNAIESFELEEDASRILLVNIPGMTDEIADAILDWVDADDTQRTYGAESGTYESFTPPYMAANAPLESLDELLLVQGVTPQLLYGEDANRNGLLDPNENDGEAQLPLDNADGLLDPGWSAYLTVHSRESNLGADGAEKIEINNGVLADLYDQLQPELGDAAALFITAYRIYGATNLEPLPTSGTSGSSSSGDDSAPSTTGDAQTDESLQRMAQGLARAVGGAEGQPVTRAGLDLTQGAQQDVASLYELIDAEVVATINEEEQTLKSPWSSTGDLEAIKQLFDNVGTNIAPTIEGRININQARREVLLGLPGMTDAVADSIVNSQLVAEDGTANTDELERRSSSAWLLTDGIANVTTMRMLDPYITGRGDVFRLQVLGHFDRRGPIVRIEAVIDRIESPPRVISRRDLTKLGPGYRTEWLVPADTTAAPAAVR